MIYFHFCSLIASRVKNGKSIHYSVVVLQIHSLTGVRLMDGAMGKEEDVVEAVLTCEGDFHDPELKNRIERFRHRLKDLLLTDKRKLQVKKVEPWNSVKVTFSIPREAAIRLRQLAQSGNDALRQMGVLSVQIQGDTQISLTIAGRNNEPTQLLLRTPSSASQGSSSSIQLGGSVGEPSVPSSDRIGSSPGPSNDEVTRKNIVGYLRQGAALRQNALFDSILGSGASPSVGLGIGLGIPPPPDSFPGPSGSNLPLRPNNIASTALQNQALRGSQLSSFPFTKTTGAFHPPIPRLPSSAGQSAAPTSSHLIQSGNTSRLVGPPRHDISATAPGFSNSGPSHLGMSSSMNSFSPLNTVRPPAASSGTNFNPQILHVPPSSSPSNFMMDLPPPPPYPHTSTSTSRPGKPVTASSPLLVNLLQTDPQAVTAGMASGNPNKPLSDGDNGGSPPKKKRKSKKVKDGMVKPCVSSDSSPISKSTSNSDMFTSSPEVSRIPRMFEDGTTPGSSNPLHMRDPFSVDLVQPRVAALPVSHVTDSFIPSLPLDSKPLFSPDRPFSESHTDNPSSAGFRSDSNSRSAIEAASSGSNVSDSNGQEPFSKDLDPFSMEIAAGKIINPYTGQLEPRDSVVDSGAGRIRDQPSHSQGDNFATQMLARKAKELEDMSKKSVPNSSTSNITDVHVMRTTILTPINVSTSTAAFVRSGGSTSQVPSEKVTSSVPSHHRTFNSDSTAGECGDSSAPSSIYAANTTKSWQEIVGSAEVGARTVGHTNSSPLKVSSTVSSGLQRTFAPTSALINGPVAAGGHTLKPSVIPSQHQHIGPSIPSGASLAPSGSVIYSSGTISSSSSLPLSHPARFTHKLGEQPTSATTTVQERSPLTLQSSFNKSVSASSSIPHASQLGSASFPSSSASSAVQASERQKLADPSHISSNQQNQAASSETTGGINAPKTSSPNLLNSLPDKHIDSQSSTESPPDNKVSSDGDENSNHSGLAPDTLPEHSGTAALLEHAGVKTENHDSGVGSSSERSDDTPSEPGDGEFRSGHPVPENEDNGSKASTHKPNCKLESKVSSSSNTITVGYMVSPGDGLTQSKLTNDHGHSSKLSPVSVAPNSSSSTDISQFFDAHIQSMEKQSGLLTGGRQASSVNWMMEEGKTHHQPNYANKGRENGPSPDDMGNIPGMKMNGPTSQGNLGKMIMAMNEYQQKKLRSSPKQNSKKGMVDIPSEHHLKLQAEVLEKMSKLHQFAETTKETSDILSKTNSTDKADSPDVLSQRLSTPEERADQLIFDMEELVNGKTLGHSAAGIEGKGGNNITSIYSKRNSPVNVNMLNHIYAPGLPLPRRLTESVQRLVKPLPASEMSVSMPQLRPCKSPASGMSPRASSGTSSQSSLRMSVHSGARSPGASMPKLIPNDKHSLLSGGLDLAGLSSLQYPSTHGGDPAGLASMMVNCKKGTPALKGDSPLKDAHPFSTRQSSPPNLLLDSKAYSGKMLSQSYPPHKSRDLLTGISQMNHDLVFSLQSNSLSLDKTTSSVSLQSNQHNEFSKSKTESLHSLSQDNKCPSNRLYLQETHSNHSSPSILDTGQTRLVSQPSTAAEFTHSNSTSQSTDLSGPYTTHSNASSPIMPILQRGQEPPGTPTLALSMPSISSQPPSISSAKEISPSSIGSNASVVSSATVSTLNKQVPYSSNTTSASVTSGTTFAKSSASSWLPTLSPVSTAPPTLGKTDSMAASLNYSAPPKLSVSSSGASTPPKLTKVNLPSNAPPSSPRNGSQHSRNLFESVSGTFSNDNVSPSKSEHHMTNNCSDMSVTQTSQHKSDSHDSQGVSTNAVFLSNDAKVDQMVRNIKQKSSDGGNSRSGAFAVVEKHKLELQNLNASPNSKPSVVSSDSTSVVTQVINLDSCVTSESSRTIALNNITSVSVSNSLGNAAETSTPQQTYNSWSVTRLSESQIPTSLSTQSNSNVYTSSIQQDIVAETIASVAAGKDETTSKLTSALPASSATTSPVKEPILETLASEALGSATSKMSSFKSSDETQAPVSTSTLETQKGEQDEETVERKMVTIQSNVHKSEDHSGRNVSGDAATAGQGSDLSRRITRKRKSTHSEEDTREGESENPAESTPVKQPRLGSIQSPVLKTAKPPTVSENSSSKVDTPVNSDGMEVKTISHSGKFQTLHKTTGVGSGDSPDKGKEDKSHKVPAASAHEEKDSHRPSKPPRTSVLENKEPGSVKEGRPHRSAGSSDERSNRSSSNESKDSVHKESRSHRNSTSSNSDNKEARQRASVNTGSGEEKEKEQVRDGRSHRASSVDHKENAPKETSHKGDHRTHRAVTNSHDDKDDHKESRSQRSSSAEDREKSKSGKELSAEKASVSDKGNTDKNDDGHKKNHRIKRQFYAYVPERSIDQTYFDTPILSGRTRSKNKPSDMAHEVGPAQDGSAAPTANSVDSQPHPVSGGQQATPAGRGDSAASGEGPGGKRSTRSVRTKDNSQDQNASKRRRVQQQR